MTQAFRVIPVMLAATAALTSACVEPPLPEVTNAVKAAAQCRGAAGSSYLPAALFRTLPKYPSPDGDWTSGTSQILAAMGEPPLWCGTTPDSYRILWLHSFSGFPRTRSRWPPTLVRVSRTSGRWTLTAVQLASAVNRTVSVRRQRALTDLESRALLSAVQTFDLWNRRDFMWNPNVENGAEWVIEGRRGTAYHPGIFINADRERVERLAAAFLAPAGFDVKMLKQGMDIPVSTNTDILKSVVDWR